MIKKWNELIKNVSKKMNKNKIVMNFKNKNI